MYEIRLKTSNPTTTTTYDATDISVTTTAQTWTVDYPAITNNSTSIALTATPSGSQTYNQSVSLNATVTPAVPGTIQFENNGSPIGAAQSETNGAVSTTTAALGVTLPVGSDDLDAVFTPAANYAYNGSTTSPGNTVDYTVNPIGTTRTISSVLPASPEYAGTSETIQATVTTADSSAPSGTVQFEYQLNGTGPEVDLGSPQSAAGTPSVTTASLPVGTDDLTTIFTPSSTDYRGHHRVAGGLRDPDPAG